MSEISVLLNEIDHALKHLNSWAREKSWVPPWSLLPGKSPVIQEPLGAVLVIAPWNYPFQLALAPVIGAIAAGNAVVIKPSEISSHTQDLLQELINDHFPQEFLHVIIGEADVSRALTQLPFDFIFFTGSTNTGRHVMRAASENLVPVCLELGGKSPCIVDKNVNLEVAARRIVWGKFYNGGQTCVAPDFICVHKNISREFQKQMVRTITDFFGEDPQQSKDYPRIISDNHFNRLIGLIEPNKVITGGKTVAEERYIEPTLMFPVEWSDAVMGEEIFGPILPMMEYEDLSALIKTLNEQPKALALYIFTHDKEVKEKVLREISFGGGCVNDTLIHLADPDLPFGGVGDSGMGAYHGKRGFDLFSHQKSVVDKSTRFDFRFRYPPYSEAKKKLLKKLIS